MKTIQNIEILNIKNEPLKTEDGNLKVVDILIAHATNIEEKGKKGARALATAIKLTNQAEKEFLELEDAEFDLLYDDIEKNEKKILFRPVPIVYGRMSEVLENAKE